MKLNAKFEREYIKNTNEKLLKIKNFEVFKSIKTGGNKYRNDAKKVYKNIIRTSNNKISTVILSANCTRLPLKNKSDTSE